MIFVGIGISWNGEQPNSEQPNSEQPNSKKKMYAHITTLLSIYIIN